MRIMCNYVKDSAHIQEFEAEWRNRKGKRAGKKEIEPLYTVEDAEKVSRLFVECEYKKQNTCMRWC